MTQSSMTISPPSNRPAAYTLQVLKDTWLKLSPVQSSTLPNDQKQLVQAGTRLPLSSFQAVAPDHLRVTLGVDEQGQKVHIRGRNTWHAYQLDVRILQGDQVVFPPQTGFTPAPAPAPAPASRPPATYSLRTTADTWLKVNTIQSSSLPDDQKQFLPKGAVLPISSFGQVNDHLRVAFGIDEQGNQIFFNGRNTWYVYRPAAEILRNGQVILSNQSAVIPPPPPPVTSSSYSVEILSDTWFKQSTTQGSSLPDDQKQLVPKGTVLPLSGFSPASANHMKLTLGQDSQGQQVQYKGRNTWYVYQPDVRLLRDGQPIDPATPKGKPQINAKGLRLLKSFEGLRLVAYQDSVGVWTIGYGTTSGVRPGMRITEAQAEEFLKRDLDRFEDAVASLVQVPLTDDQFSALVSFVYNVGETAFANSTLLKLLNRRDYRGAADQLLRWNRAGSQELAGLTRRRRAERALFLGQDYTVFL